MAVSPIVAVEIGTSKVVALVGELREDGHVVITGMGEAASSGVRKGEIVDLENAAVCVRSVLGMAEQSGNVYIRQVYLAVSGGHIQSVINRGTVPVLDRRVGITSEDVEQVMEVARAVNLAPDREILHTICRHYCIDDQERVLKPVGMDGAKLSLDVLVVHGVRTRINNTVRVIKNLPVAVQDVAFSGLCSALAVLRTEQKKSGVVVIDLGGGTTNYLAYADGVVAAAGALGVGGDHITNDVALAFNIPTSQAETLKRGSGSALVQATGSSPRVTLPPEVGFPGRTVSVKALQTVIHARVQEILTMIFRRLEREALLHQIGAGVVLTGGGAHLKGMVELAEQVFGLPCSIGTPINVNGLASVTGRPEYATCCGLVLYGFKTSAERPGGSSFFRGLWRGLFGRQ